MFSSVPIRRAQERGSGNGGRRKGSARLLPRKTTGGQDQARGPVISAGETGTRSGGLQARAHFRPAGVREGAGAGPVRLAARPTAPLQPVPAPLDEPRKLQLPAAPPAPARAAEQRLPGAPPGAGRARAEVGPLGLGASRSEAPPPAGPGAGPPRVSVGRARRPRPAVPLSPQTAPGRLPRPRRAVCPLPLTRGTLTPVTCGTPPRPSRLSGTPTTCGTPPSDLGSAFPR